MGRRCSVWLLVWSGSTFFHSRLRLMTRLELRWHSFIPRGLRIPMRTLAKNRENLRDGFMCPGGWKVLVDYYESLAQLEKAKIPEAVAV
ncbi:ATP sulfurylase 1, chloroplastic-like protein [Drosera capensis]